MSTTLTLKEITKKIGISPDDVVQYREKGDKGIIEIDLKVIRRKKQKKKIELDIFENILTIAEDIGIEDWSLNHDHYLYGTPKRTKDKNGWI